MPVRYFPALFVLLWATGFIGAGYAMPYAEPFGFMTVRFFIAAAILGVWALLSGSRWPNRRGAFHAAVAGCLIHGIYLSGVFWAVHRGLPAGMSALVVGLQPLITTLIAGATLGEKVERRHWTGLAIGFIGVVMVLWPKFSLDTGGINAVTIGAVFLAVIAISTGTVWQKRFVGQVDLKTGTTIQYLAAGVLTGVFSLCFEDHQVIWSPWLLFAMAWLVLVLSIGAILLLMVLIREGAVSKVASLFYLVPGTTALMAYLLFGETLNLVQLIGMAITTFGMALATVRSDFQLFRFARQAMRLR
ncbi:peptide ABC transporter ATP-binding protein [Paramesorhizobium deserti]|uniref:Peptide ABC transporter ATP-binding protein n=1 Tax=Paramesorhizobium deserti TaxID=1494590 RepID=A0A135I1Q7_9HYPH|nr:EamA family transporter [Paramesorhizobium deserti]KXF79348.1 peptide ABC transporter ATP-binding protein [Paramesorhizobium deserti]